MTQKQLVNRAKKILTIQDRIRTLTDELYDLEWKFAKDTTGNMKTTLPDEDICVLTDLLHYATNLDYLDNNPRQNQYLTEIFEKLNQK